MDSHIASGGGTTENAAVVSSLSLPSFSTAVAFFIAPTAVIIGVFFASSFSCCRFFSIGFAAPSDGETKYDSKLLFAAAMWASCWLKRLEGVKMIVARAWALF